MRIKDINESYSIITFENTPNDIAMQQKLAIMETLSVFVEGYRYMPSYRAGVFDGKKHFYKITPNGLQIPKGLVESIILKFGKWLDEEYKSISKFTPITMEEVKEFVNTLYLPFTPRDYQYEAIYKCINQPRKIAVMATGSGKSLVIYILMRYFKSIGKKGVLIVPDVGLVEQMRGDFISYNYKSFDEDCHIIYAGKEKHFNKDITISTWQSTYTNLHLFKDIDYILIDEAHKAQSEVLSKILAASTKCTYKIGVTGTLPSSKVDRYTIGATLGKSEVIISPQRLIELGYATPVEINMLFLNYNEKDKKAIRKCKSFAQEVTFIEEHKQRNTLLSKLVIHGTKKYGNSLLLYNKLKHGELLTKMIVKERLSLDIDIEKMEYIPKLTLKKVQNQEAKGIKVILTNKNITFSNTTNIKIINIEEHNIFFIRGDVNGEDRNSIRSLLENTTDGILIATFGTVSTGINIKRLHNIFLGISTKSTIRLNQTIGRGMRLFDEKEIMRLIDIVDDFSRTTKTGRKVGKNYVLKHSEERINDYLSHGYPIIEKEIHLE